MSKQHQHTAHHPQAKAANGNSGERETKFRKLEPRGHDKTYGEAYLDHSRTGMTPHYHGVGWEDTVYC